MLSELSGNKDSVDAFNRAIGMTIVALSITDSELVFTFDDGSKMELYDDAQSCCEHRYMSTDDDLSYYVGSKLMSAATQSGPSIEACEYHDTEFLIVTTSVGSFTVVNHNEHNGYYGGFAMRARKAR